MKSFEKNVEVNSERADALLNKAKKYGAKVAGIVTKKDYRRHESALAIPTDDAYQNDIQKKIAHVKGAKHVILIGIGGSSLGVEAVYSALALKTNPELHVYDSIDEEALKDIGALTEGVEREGLAVVVVSKSGTTTETITNAVSVLKQLEEKYGKNIVERFVFVGGEGTDFLKIGKKKKVTCVTFPDSIGGRYSVFTAVGIVPLSILGIDVTSLLEGASDASSKKYRTDIIERSVSLVALGEGGVHTVNFFTFNKRLKLLGFWYRQLLAESIGKNMTTAGATFSHQLLPTVATDVDLHSMAQLYLGGYKGLYTHFVYADTEGEHHALTNHWLIPATKMIDGHTPKEIRNAIRDGVLQAYDEQKLPYRVTTLDKITAYEVGLMMGSLMFEVMCVGHLFDIDTFNQPNVESYKSYTRDILNV